MTARLPALRDHRRRYLMISLWAFAVVSAFSAWWLYGRHVLEPEDWRVWVTDNLLLASFLYFSVLSLRGIFLIPSTPLLFAGIVLFPGLWVWTLNMAGILTSSALVYTLVRGFGFDFMVRQKYQKRVRQLSALLHKHDFKVIISWSFFPAVTAGALPDGSGNWRGHTDYVLCHWRQSTLGQPDLVSINTRSRHLRASGPFRRGSGS